MTEFRYDIFEGVDVQATLAKARKAFARGADRGLEGGFTVTVEDAVQTNELGFTVTKRQFVVTGTPYKFNGWTFVAAVEWLADGQALTKVLTGYEGEVVDREWLRKGACDHCQTTRSRKKQFVVEDESGTRLLVGSTCVKDFVGWDFKVTFFADLKDAFDDWAGGGSGKYDQRVDITQFLAAVVAVSATYGWKSRSAAQTEGGAATVDTTWEFVFGRGESARETRKQVGEVTEAHFTKAAALLEFARTFEGDSEYALNLRAASAQTAVDLSTAALVASAVAAYANWERKQLAQETKRQTYTQELYAEVGTKVDVTAEVLSVSNFEGYYGTTWVYTYAAEGYVFKWLSSSYSGGDKGDKVQLKGTVKKRDEWNGLVSTQLTRCRVTALTPAA